ncbi:hypothetical protein KAU04_08790, partial [bacterium]|nr:hypothetical protein [bacterium]
MPIWKKRGIQHLIMSILALLFVTGTGHAQISQVWTETTEEDFASGLGVDTVNVDIRTSPGDIILAEANENFALGKSAKDDDSREDNENPPYGPADNLLDGDIKTYWSSMTQYALGVSIIVD